MKSVGVQWTLWDHASTTSRLIEHGFTSAPTQYRLYGRRFLQVWWPNQQCQSTEGGWLVIQTGLSLTRLTSPCYNTTPCMQILYKKIPVCSVVKSIAWYSVLHGRYSSPIGRNVLLYLQRYKCTFNDFLSCHSFKHITFRFVSDSCTDDQYTVCSMLSECERSLFHDSVCSVFWHARVYAPAIPMGFYGN